MNVGDQIPLYFQTVDCNSGVYVQAKLYDATGTLFATRNLTELLLGMYFDTSLVFPNTQFVFVQYVAYSDSGYSVISPSEGAGQDLFLLGGAPIPGQPMPIGMQLFDCDDGQFPVCYIWNDQGVQIPGSPAVLTAVGELGFYQNTAFTVPVTKFLAMQYVVYEDSGHTVISPTEGATEFTFPVNPTPTPNVLPAFYPVVGVLDSDVQNNPLSPYGGIEDEIVIGSDHTLAIRLVNGVNQEPLDLTNVTRIVAKFLNADRTVTDISSTDAGNPIFVAVPGAGKITCVVSAAQSSLFMEQDPAPFSLVLTISGKTMIVNFPYQLQIANPSVE